VAWLWSAGCSCRPGGPAPRRRLRKRPGRRQDSPGILTVAEALRALGFVAFLFDLTGHGESEGTTDDSTLEQQVDDLGAALSSLDGIDDVAHGRIGVVGASSGAAVAVLGAAHDARIRVLVLRSANLAGAEAPRFGGPRALEVVPGGDHLFRDAVALARAATATVDWFKAHLR